MGTEHHQHVQHGAFGTDAFGRLAERFARFFGTPRFLIAQTFLVALWITLNAGELAFQAFDPFPNPAEPRLQHPGGLRRPLILLAQTRQADRDKAQALADAKHREELAAEQTKLLERNQQLIEQVVTLTEEVRAATCSPKP